MAPFGADGGGRAVAGQDPGIVGKRQEPGLDGFNDLARVATREIGATDAAVEEGITGDDHFERREVKTNRTLGMARSEQDFSRVAIETDFKAVGEAEVGSGHIGCGDPDPCGLLFHHFEKGEIVLVQKNGSAREVLQLECSAYVVDVAVGDQDLGELESEVGETAVNPADLVAGVNDDGFGGVLVAEQGAVALQGADDEGLENHQDILAIPADQPIRGGCG
jgi:hypothetical protein